MYRTGEGTEWTVHVDAFLRFVGDKKRVRRRHENRKEVRAEFPGAFTGSANFPDERPAGVVDLYLLGQLVEHEELAVAIEGDVRYSSERVVVISFGASDNDIDLYAGPFGIAPSTVAVVVHKCNARAITDDWCRKGCRCLTRTSGQECEKKTGASPAKKWSGCLPPNNDK